MRVFARLVCSECGEVVDVEASRVTLARRPDAVEAQTICGVCLSTITVLIDFGHAIALRQGGAHAIA